MAQPIKTDQELFEICARLDEEGNLTGRNVRMAAGGGDPSRINSILRQYRSSKKEQGAPDGRSAEADPTTATPSELPSSVDGAIRRLAGAIGGTLLEVRREEEERARATAHALTRAHLGEVASLKEELQQALADRRDTEQLASELTQQLEAAQERIAVLEEQARTAEVRLETWRRESEAAVIARQEAEGRMREVERGMVEEREALRETQDRVTALVHSVELVERDRGRVRTELEATRQEVIVLREELARKREETASALGRLEAEQALRAHFLEIGEHLREVAVGSTGRSDGKPRRKTEAQ